MGWAANPTRKPAGDFSLQIIQMGARVYIPNAGRFLQVDPIEGGTANAYAYPADPINFTDYSGQAAACATFGFARGLCDMLIKDKGSKTKATTLNVVTSALIKAVRPAPARYTKSRAASKPAAKTKAKAVQKKKATVNGHDITKIKKAPRDAWKEGSNLGTGGIGWDVRSRIDHAIDTGNQYGNYGQYAGMAAGCTAGAAVAVYSSAATFGTTAFLAGAACMGGMQTGGELGYVVGGGIGFVVGMFDY